ncbi:MAG: extracellular solute-binding protein [Lachnospiraceae bacterium]|nr:extracellular solute-binding protein [Lachnospiraceae bacterium]
MHRRVKLFSILALAGITAGLFAYNGFLENLSEDEEISEIPGVFGKETIRFWYADESLSDYINSAAVAFGEAADIRVIPELVSESEYLEAINNATVREDVFPDMYLISNDSLEKAYLSGLATEIQDTKGVVSEDNFSQAALSAVTYQGEYVGYPMYYETTALLYNETYLQEWAAQQETPTEATVPANFDELLTMADTFDPPESVESIFTWDVSDIFYNYYLIGNYINVGGEAGDDREQINLYNNEAVLCLQKYQALNQFFSIDSATVDYESILQDFVDGKVVFTVATTDAAAKLAQAKEEGAFTGDYGFAMMPDVTADLKSRSLSITGCLAISSYSEKKEEANEFATFLVTEYADELYGRTGKMSANKGMDTDNGAAMIFQAEYGESIPLSKMIDTSNLWIQLEVLFSKVWNSGDADALLQETANQVSTQVVK